MEVEEGASVGVGGGKIKVGVCVMEKKVKCGSDVIFHFLKKFVTARCFLLLTNRLGWLVCSLFWSPLVFYYVFFSIAQR